jgi:CheY-like chemotaxis protein
MRERPLVLCADDDEDILALIALRLERAGYDVARATDGERALELARSLRPDVLVLDVMMPRRSGDEVVRALRSDVATRDLRMILLSARVHESDVQRGIDVGADAYLGKPFKAPELVGLVASLLSRGGQTRV